MRTLVVKHSIISGILASSASLVGKLCMSSDIDHHLNAIITAMGLSGDTLTANVINMTRVSLFVLMIAINILMWTQFSKALNYSLNSLQVMSINTATNFSLSAFYGSVFFGESLPLLWWFGISLILTGVLLLHTSGGKHFKND